MSDNKRTPEQPDDVKNALDDMRDVLCESGHTWAPLLLDEVETYISTLEAQHTSAPAGVELDYHKVDRQVLHVAREMSEADKKVQPEWLWWSHEAPPQSSPSFGRWPGMPGGVPYVRADLLTQLLNDRLAPSPVVPSSAAQLAPLDWHHTNTICFDDTMHFGLGGLSDDIETCRLEALTPLTNYLIFPNLGQRWCLYETSEGGYWHEKFINEEDAKRAAQEHYAALTAQAGAPEHANDNGKRGEAA